jgi:hypothetical protein
MNIYIYGGKAFTNEIHKILDRSNIRLKIDDGVIRDVETLEQIKQLIKDEPYEIYLIDENRIIEDDFVSKYFKFLLPKNGIKKTFLDKYGIGDIGLRTYDDLLIYIQKRLETAPRKPKATQITTLEDMFEAFEFDEEEEQNKQNIQQTQKEETNINIEENKGAKDKE